VLGRCCLGGGVDVLGFKGGFAGGWRFVPFEENGWPVSGLPVMGSMPEDVPKPRFAWRAATLLNAA
jgi:hypothetical protein